MKSIEIMFLSDAISKEVYDKNTERVKVEKAVLTKELSGTEISNWKLEKNQ